MIQQLEHSRTWHRALGITVVVLMAVAMWVVGGRGADAATFTVDATGFAFNPADLTVRVGDTVTWKNGDNESHAPEGGSLSSPEIRTGESWSHTFTAPEDISYICRFHTYMTGTIHVLAAGAPATTAPPTTVAPEPSGATATTTPVPTTTAATLPTATTAAPRPGSGPGFQDVPDDPSARIPPSGGTAPASKVSPTPTAPPTTTPVATPNQFQEVPDDPAEHAEPGEVHAARASTGAAATGSTGSFPSPIGGGTALGDGTFLAPYTKDGAVKVFHLDMAPTKVETSPGVTKDAYAFNGVVPGPTLRVAEGDRVRIIVKNDLPFATSTHWHGMILPNDQDGVGGITQDHIEPGQTYTYEWTAVATGTHWYHAHSSGRHIGKGLYGALEVVPKKGDLKADRDYTFLLGDTDLGFTINGRSFPNTPTIEAATGETVRLRVVNTGDQVHAFHLHGVPFRVMAQDGIPKPEPEGEDTLTIAPGQTYDLLFRELYPGRWVVHCHMFVHSHDTSDTHAEGESGMVGMTAVVRVTGDPVSDSPGLMDALGSLASPIRSPQFGAAAAFGLGSLGSALLPRRRRPSTAAPLHHGT